MKSYVFFFMTAFSSTLLADSWTDDWFDNSTSGGSSSYQSQQRGYYSAGSFSGRWRMQNDYVVSATPPRISVGCGGIDMFAGGISYLDPEYLVEKAERIIQAAPAFAFDLAINEYCKVCKTAKDYLENASNFLNGLQMNECSMSKNLVLAGEAYTKVALAEMKGTASQETSLVTDQRKNATDFKEKVNDGDGRAPDDTNEMLSACPTVFKDIFLNGSVMENSAGLVGLNEYADIIRGLMGDAIVNYDTDSKLYKVETLEPCDQNDSISADDFIDGQFSKKEEDDTCSPAGESAIQQVVENTLDGIITKIKTGGNLTAEQIAFINRAPLPIFVAIRDGIASGTEDAVVEQYIRPLSMHFAYTVLNDLFKASSTAVSAAVEAARDLNADPAADARKCNASFVSEAITHVSEIKANARKFRSMANANYKKEMEVVRSNIIMTAEMKRSRIALIRSAQRQSETQ